MIQFDYDFSNGLKPPTTVVIFLCQAFLSRGGTALTFSDQRSGKFHVGLQLLRRCLLPAALVFIFHLGDHEKNTRLACLWRLGMKYFPLKKGAWSGDIYPLGVAPSQMQ